VIFAYKINTGKAGTYPVNLRERLDPKGRIHLTWRGDLDNVDEGDEVWVIFIGPGIQPGLYCKGIVDQIDPGERLIWLRISSLSAADPLPEQAATLRRLLGLVNRSRKQIFVYDEDASVSCQALQPDAPSCRNRGCDACAFWLRLPRVAPGDTYRPERLSPDVRQLFAGFWAVPRRSGVMTSEVELTPETRSVNMLLKAFKAGESGLTYAFVAALHEAVISQPKFDAVVPIPLSPEKLKAGDLERTKALAIALSSLLRVPLREALLLHTPVGKRSMQRAGAGPARFEEAYEAALVLETNKLGRPSRILLVDDVCTSGSTLSVAARTICRQYPAAEVSAAVGVVMALKASGVAVAQRLTTPDEPITSATKARTGRMSRVS